MLAEHFAMFRVDESITGGWIVYADKGLGAVKEIT